VYLVVFYPRGSFLWQNTFRFGEVWFEAVVNRQPSITEKEESQETFTAKLLV
jgi:hypothetical protein